MNLDRETVLDWPEPLPRGDGSPDTLFYRFARLVTHIDDGAIAAVTALYRERVAPGSRILDLMSSWVSHLPADVQYDEVVGLGLNAEELAQNPRLWRHVVHDLNADPSLPFPADHFDAATICVSIDYLVRPTEVLRALAHTVRPGGVLVITFSNRCFPTKAVRPWLLLDDAGHLEFVARRVARSGRWGAIEQLDRSPPGGDPLFAVVARRI